MQPHQRIYAVFFIFALAMGAMLARIPDLQVQFQLTESQLGLMLLGMPIGSLISLTLSSPLIERLGARTTAMITIIGSALLYAMIPWMPGAQFAFFVLLCAGLLAGSAEIVVNLETDRHEARLGKRIMNRTHGMWSIGFFVTALISAGVRQAGIATQWHLLAMLIVVAIAGVIVFSGIENAPARPGSHEGDTRGIAFPTLALIPLCIIGASPLLVEGASIDWSGIYMRDAFNAPPFIGGLALTLFSLSMALARLFIDPVVDRHSPRMVATVLLLLAGIGVTMVWLAPHEYVALVGYMLIGLGCSAVYPLAVSAAAQRTDRPAAVNVAALAQISFVVFLLAPPLLGFVAEHWGIRSSYLVCLPLVALSLLLVRALSPRRGPVPVVAHAEALSPHA